MTHCIGSLISVNCGDEGIYQGKLVSLDSTNKNVTLNSAFKNGCPVGAGKSIVINGSQIQKLKVLKAPNPSDTLKDLPTLPTPPVPPPPQSVFPSSKQSKPSPLPRVSVNDLENEHTVGTQTNASLSTVSASKINGNVKLPKHSYKACTSGSGSDCRVDTTSSVFSSSDHRRGRRVVRESISTDESDTTSSTERVSPSTHRYSQQRVQRAKSKSVSKTKSTRRTSDHESSSGGVPEIAPTPLFRKFEPQIPCPQQSQGSVKETSGRKTHQKQGPCGIPALDALNSYGKIQGKNVDLNEPIDFDQLNTDFDFESNLELFKQEVDGEQDDEYYEEVEQPKMSKNFAHYENIVHDPLRITSWTNINDGKGKEESSSPSKKHSKKNGERSSGPYSTTSFESTISGSRMPVLAADLKKKLLRQSERFLGSDVFHSLCADRLLAWVLDVSKRNALSLSEIVVIASESASHQLIDRFLMHLSNRNVNTVVFGCEQHEHLSSVRFVDSVSLLPKNTRLSVCLDGDNSCDEVIDWICSSGAHTVTMESIRTRIAADRQHPLHLCTLTTGLTAPAPLTVGRTSFAALCAAINPQKGKMDMAVADLGIPYSWLSSNCSAALTDCFSSQLWVRL